MSVWSQLARFKPEEVEAFFERVFADYNQSFRPIAVDEKNRLVHVELKDGRNVKVKI